jgi:hypothetical protein
VASVVPNTGEILTINQTIWYIQLQLGASAAHNLSKTRLCSNVVTVDLRKENG